MIELPVATHVPYSTIDIESVVVEPGDLVDYKITIGYAVERAIPVLESVGKISSFSVKSTFGFHVVAGEAITHDAAYAMANDGLSDVIVRMADGASSAGHFRLLKRSVDHPGRWVPIEWPEAVAKEYGGQPEELQVYMHKVSDLRYFNPDPELGKPFCVGDGESYIRATPMPWSRGACTPSFKHADESGNEVCPYRKSRHPLNKHSPCKPYGVSVVSVHNPGGSPLVAAIETTSIDTHNGLKEVSGKYVSLRTGEMQKIAVGGRIGRFPTIGTGPAKDDVGEFADPNSNRTGHETSVRAFDAEFRPSNRIKQMPAAVDKGASEAYWYIADARARLLSPEDYKTYLKHRNHVRPSAVPRLVEVLHEKVAGLSEDDRRTNAELNSGIDC